MAADNFGAAMEADTAAWTALQLDDVLWVTSNISCQLESELQV